MKNASRFVSPVDLPKEAKIKQLDDQFKSPIVSVDLATGIDTGIGLDAEWQRESQRARMIFPTLGELIQKSKETVKVKISNRKWGHVCVEEVLKAWEDSGHNKAEAARMMKVSESAFRNWIGKFVPGSIGDGRHFKTGGGKEND